MSDSTRSADLTGESLSGTARLWAAVPVAIVTFFYTNILECRAFQDVGQLLRNSTFWALVIPLALLGGPVFQASNQFLPYRAEDLGLKQGSEDLGWIWLKLLQTIMWIPGGVAVGMLAGRRAPGLAAVAMLGAFSLAAAGIGFSAVAWQIFVSVAFFEFARQFMRWSHAGYMSEHMPDSLRATAIDCTITFSGLGSTIYSWVAPIITCLLQSFKRIGTSPHPALRIRQAPADGDGEVGAVLAVHGQDGAVGEHGVGGVRAVPLIPQMAHLVAHVAPCRPVIVTDPGHHARKLIAVWKTGLQRCSPAVEHNSLRKMRGSCDE